MYRTKARNNYISRSDYPDDPCAFAMDWLLKINQQKSNLWLLIWDKSNCPTAIQTVSVHRKASWLFGHSVSSSLSSHVSVLDVLPVHHDVLLAQRPHLAQARQHVALENVSAFPVHLWRGRGVDAVLLEARHRLPGRQTNNTYQVRGKKGIRRLNSSWCKSECSMLIGHAHANYTNVLYATMDGTHTKTMVEYHILEWKPFPLSSHLVPCQADEQNPLAAPVWDQTS